MNNKWKKSLITLSLIALSFVSGYLYSNYKNSLIIEPISAFYAEVKKVDDFYMLVSGLNINDINHQGEFSFLIEDSTSLLWRGTLISLDEIHVNDIVLVYYSGTAFLTNPAFLYKVFKVELLNDDIGLS